MKERQFTVVIADDAPEDRAALHDAFSRDPAASFVVIEAESGGRALELCLARKPDCLILKGDLPDLRVLDALKKLAPEEGLPACAVVVLVDAGDARLTAEVMSSGAHDCLERDRARGAELRRAVSRAIEKAERRRREATFERELIEKNRALEAGLAALQKADYGRAQSEEAWQAADIAERKRAETALRESQALNQAALDSLAANIALLDRDGNIIAVNEAWKRFARENGGAAIADSVGINYLDVCRRAKGRGDGGALASLEGIQAVLNGARPNFMIEYPCHSPDEKRWFLMSVTPLGGERGGAAVAHTDITARKRAEEAIIESESRIRQHMDAMPQMVYTSHADGMNDYVNRRWQEYTGLSWEQCLGAGWVESLHPDDRERVWRQWAEAVKAGQPFETEYRLRREDGQYRWHLSRAIPIRDGRRQIIKWIGTSTDIHDRKKAEAEREELLARERASRAEAEHSAESIRRLQAVTDSALMRLTIDDLLREMLARIRELLATDSATILLLTEDGQALTVRATIGWEEAATGMSVPFGQGMAGAIAASRAPLVVEDISAVEAIAPILQRNARSLIGAPLIVEGRLIGVIHAGTTRPRRFTEGDVRLLQLAADRVALAIEQSRLYEVEWQARRQAEEANRMKDEFLALVSHELRSPLNAILGYATLLRYGGLDAQKIKQAAEVIDRSGKAQAQLIDDLLDTARIISGKLRLELGPVDLISVIEQAVQTIRPAADAKGISIETDLPSEIGQITGDPARLQQVVWNLLSNAVKFTPQGGRVEARLERADPFIRITVSDTGKGVSPDFRLPGRRRPSEKSPSGWRKRRLKPSSSAGLNSSDC